MSNLLNRYLSTRASSLLEAGIWVVGVGAMCFADPTAESWIELCVFKWVGLGECPGCGLGHALGFLVRGEWSQALDSHIFAPAVAAVLMHRVGTLTIRGLTVGNRN